MSAVNGQVDDRLAGVVAALERDLAADPDYSFQAAAYHGGRLILDIWAGPNVTEDSITVPYSVTKNVIGVSIGLALERGLLDLDERVATYWPEFAAAGKAEVTVRQLLSHQAGLPQAEPALTATELLDHRAGSDRLARTRPFWRPGTAFGYHALTIGNLASELIRRVTVQTLHDFYETQIRLPYGIDFYLGLPPEQDHRRVPLLPVAVPEDVTRDEPTALGRLVFAPAAPDLDLGNDEVSWRFGHPAASGAGSARGLARLLAAAVTGVEGEAPFLSRETVARIGEQQVRGFDEVLGQPDRAHAIVFQKPSAQLRWGGPRSFGHDGAMGAVACVDPATGVSFAYTLPRGPWPGGADPRAIRAAAAINEVLCA
ncbi:serine hydrolase domain-containing protein [Tessaracoccus lapidicaptus]|uniref:serine hydrolase domain-containing protein n=1 Tax=Tessaracoccus lapidicaptus TaxID=1427523 RepID=UPI0033402B8F